MASKTNRKIVQIAQESAEGTLTRDPRRQKELEALWDAAGTCLDAANGDDGAMVWSVRAGNNVSNIRGAIEDATRHVETAATLLRMAHVLVFGEQPRPPRKRCSSGMTFSNRRQAIRCARLSGTHSRRTYSSPW